MLTPQDIDALQKLGAFLMGCFTGFCFGWTFRPKPLPAPPPEDLPEEVMQRGERIVAASIAMERGNDQRPDVIH